MAKTVQTTKLQKRDWAIILLFLIVMVTNFWWWSINTVRDGVEKDLHITNSRQERINLRLKSCIDESVKPCDIITSYRQ